MIEHVAVVVPVHDEEVLLPVALEVAECAARRARATGVSVQVVAVLTARLGEGA